MTEQSPDDQPEDDVEGHRFLTPEQAQERAESARIEREQRRSTDPPGRDS